MRPSQAAVARGEHASSAAVAAALPPPAGAVAVAAVLAHPGRLAGITHCVDGGEGQQAGLQLPVQWRWHSTVPEQPPLPNLMH